MSLYANKLQAFPAGTAQMSSRAEAAARQDAYYDRVREAFQQAGADAASATQEAMRRAAVAAQDGTPISGQDRYTLALVEQQIGFSLDDLLYALSRAIIADN